MVVPWYSKCNVLGYTKHGEYKTLNMRVKTYKTIIKT